MSSRRKHRARRRSGPSQPVVLAVLGALVFLGAIVAVLSLRGDDETADEPPNPEVVRAYRIDNETVAEAGPTWVITFDATWAGEGEPERAGCTYQIYDEAGALLHNDTFNLFLASGSDRELTTDVQPPDDTAIPSTVDISC